MACLGAMLDGLEGEVRAQRKSDLKAALARQEKPGLLKMLRHDFRRTAVRNTVNRGVPERVAMKITGHKPRAVFDGYHIVSPADLQETARQLAGMLPEERERTLSQPTVFVGEDDEVRPCEARTNGPGLAVRPLELSDSRSVPHRPVGRSIRIPTQPGFRWQCSSSYDSSFGHSERPCWSR